MKKQAIFQAIFQFILTALALSGILLVAFFPQRIALTGWYAVDLYPDHYHHYSISGRVIDASGNPIAGVTVSALGSSSATTGSDGYYTIWLPAGTYTVIPSKSGYTFSPPSRTVTVPPNATGVDFTGSPLGVGLSYTGPLYLPADDVLVDEVDRLITTGDHVHLRLPFRNDGTQTITNASVWLCGAVQAGSQIGVNIYNGTSWWNCGQTVTLTPSTLAPGQTGFADFWIYVTNNDPYSPQVSVWIHLATELLLAAGNGGSISASRR
jgi:hypothetical protein